MKDIMERPIHEGALVVFGLGQTKILATGVVLKVCDHTLRIQRDGYTRTSGILSRDPKDVVVVEL